MNIISADQLQKVCSLEKCRSLSLFGALSSDCIAFLMEHGDVGESDAGEMLFQQGENSFCFFIVLSGRLGYYRHNGTERVFLRSYQPGEQLGFSSMIGLHERRGDAVTENEGVMLKVTSDLFHEVCQRFPEDFVIFLINMTREMSREIIDMDSICADLRTEINRNTDFL